jgi:hypothetical protein
MIYPGTYFQGRGLSQGRRSRPARDAPLLPVPLLWKNAGPEQPCSAPGVIFALRKYPVWGAVNRVNGKVMKLRNEIPCIWTRGKMEARADCNKRGATPCYDFHLHACACIFGRGLAANRQEGEAEKPKALERGGADSNPATPKPTPAEIPHVSFFPPFGGSAEGALDLWSAAITRRRSGSAEGKNIGIPCRRRPASFCGPQGRYDPTTAARCQNPQEQTRQGNQTGQEENSTPGGGSAGRFYTVFTLCAPVPAAADRRSGGISGYAASTLPLLLT